MSHAIYCFEWFSSMFYIIFNVWVSYFITLGVCKYVYVQRPPAICMRQPHIHSPPSLGTFIYYFKCIFRFEVY